MRICHTISKIDKDQRKGICSVCGLTSIRKSGNGNWRCRTTTIKHDNQKPRWETRQYIHYRKNVCQECGFVPANICQLDIHHLDRNRKNNNKENLITVCANCHRLITSKAEDCTRQKGEIMKFRKKPVVIEAEQFFKDQPLPFRDKGAVQFDGEFFVETIHLQRCNIVDGDWIVPEPDNVHFYPIKPDIFEATHETVEE